MKHTITIEVDDEAQTILVRDDLGNERDLNGIIVCGSDMVQNHWYMAAYGSAPEVGYSLARGYREAAEQALDGDNSVYFGDVFRSMAQWIGTYHGWIGNKETPPEEILERWSEEDKIDAAIKLSHKLNDPKKGGTH